MSDWVSRQEKAMCRWVSLQIGRGIQHDLSSEISDGLLLILLVNKLVDNYKLPPVHKDPQTRLQRIENIADCLQFIKFVLELNIDHISAENIADKNRKLILGLVWMLFLYLTRTSLKKVLKSDCDSFLKIKAFLRDWINLMIRRKGLGEITNFDRDWLLETSRPDLFFAAILEYYLGSDIDYAQLQSGPKLKNMNHIFEIAETLGIPHLVDLDDFASLVPDEKCVVTYLLEWLKMFELEDDEYVEQQSPTPSMQETMHEIFLKEAGKAEEEKCGRIGKQDKQAMKAVKEVVRDFEDNGAVQNQKFSQRLAKALIPMLGTIEQAKRRALRKEQKNNQIEQKKEQMMTIEQKKEQTKAIEQPKISKSNPKQSQLQPSIIKVLNPTKKLESFVGDILVQLYEERESTSPKSNPRSSLNFQFKKPSTKVLSIVDSLENKTKSSRKPLKIEINHDMKKPLILKEFKSPFDDDFEEEIAKYGSVPVLHSVESVKSDASKSKAAKTDAAVKPAESTKLEHTKTEAVTSEAIKPEAIKPEAIKPEVIKSEVVKSEVVKSEATKIEAVKTDAVKSEALDSKTAKLEGVKSEAVEFKKVVVKTEAGDSSTVEHDKPIQKIVKKSAKKSAKKSVSSNKELPPLPTDEGNQITPAKAAEKKKLEQHDVKETKPQEAQQTFYLDEQKRSSQGENSRQILELVPEEAVNKSTLCSQPDSEPSANGTEDFAEGEDGFTEPTEEFDNVKAAPTNGSPYTPKLLEQDSDLDKTPFFEEEIKQLQQQHMRKIKPKILTLQQNLRNILSETESLTNIAFPKEDAEPAEIKDDDISISSTKASESIVSTKSTEVAQIPIATSSPVLKATSPGSKPKELTINSTKSSWKKLIAISDEQTQDVIKVTQQFSADSIETMIAQLNDCFIAIRATIATGKAAPEAMQAIAYTRDSFDNLEVNLDKFNRMSGPIKASFDQGPELYTEEFLQSLERLLDTAEQFSMHSLMGICLLSSELIDVEEYEIGLARVIQNKFPFIKTNEKEQLIKVQKGFSEVLAHLKALSDNYYRSNVNEFISGLKKQFEGRKDKVLISPGFVVGRRLDVSLTKSSSDFSIFYSDASATSSLFDSPHLKPA